MDNNLKTAKEFLKLAQKFDTNVNDMNDNIEKEKSLIIDVEIFDKNKDILENTIIKAEDLIEDFGMIRKNLKNQIKTISKVIDDNAEDMNMEDGIAIKGFADLITASNKSMELLLNLYEKVTKTQIQIKDLLKKEQKENGTEVNITNVTNNIGSPSDMLKLLKDKSKS